MPAVKDGVYLIDECALVTYLQIPEEDLDDPFHLIGRCDLQQLRQDLYFAFIGLVASQLVQVMVDLSNGELHLLRCARLSATAGLEEVLHNKGAQCQLQDPCMHESHRFGLVAWSSYARTFTLPSLALSPQADPGNN